MRTNLKLFTTFSKIGNKNHDFMRVSEALIQFNCQTRVLPYPLGANNPDSKAILIRNLHRYLLEESGLPAKK